MSPLIGLLLVAVPPAVDAVAPPRITLRAGLVLKVSDLTKAADTLVASAEQVGGYLATRDDASVTVKVPAGRLAELQAAAKPLGVVLSRTLDAQDVGATLEEQRTRLKSRQEVLDRYFQVLRGANDRAVVEIEAQMIGLVEEIEALKGAIRLTEHQMEYAVLTVSFQFRDRRPPTRDGRSSFGWLNTMNLVDLVQEFSHAN